MARTPIAPRSEHERAAELPRLPAADRPRVAERPRADRGRLGEDAETPERTGNRDELRRVLGHELARETVEARDAALAVVPRQARVRRRLRAGEAVPAGSADRGGDEVAAREAGSVALDHAEQLVADHEQGFVLGCDAEVPVEDLAVGAADADLEHPDRHLALPGLRRGQLDDVGGA